jgi:hypothetical protein
MARTKITVKDMGWKKHGRAVKRGARKSPYLLVGVLAKDADNKYDEDGATTIDVAAAHEFGMGKMPERRFIRSTFDQNERVYAAMMKKFQRPVLLGIESPRKALTILGLKVQSDTLALMRRGIDPEKKDGKKARLKDTGQLYGDIQLEVNT